MSRINKKLYNEREIKNAFSHYFYGSGTEFFFPHPKMDEIPQKECREIVKVRSNEFLEILNLRKGKT